MNNIICANPKCGKELIHVEGRKKKKYCDSKCKLADWQRLHPVKSVPKFKMIPVSEWEALQSKLKEKQANTSQEENKEDVGAGNALGEEFKTTLAGLAGAVKDNGLLGKELEDLARRNNHEPIRQKGEDAIDFAARKSEWKLKHT